MHRTVTEVARADEEYAAVVVEDEPAGGKLEDRTSFRHLVMIRLKPISAGASQQCAPAGVDGGV